MEILQSVLTFLKNINIFQIGFTILPIYLILKKMMKEIADVVDEAYDVSKVWQEMLEQYQKAKEDGVLTKEELEELFKTFQRLMEEGKDVVEAAEDVLGCIKEIRSKIKK